MILANQFTSITRALRGPRDRGPMRMRMTLREKETEIVDMC